MSKRIPVSEGRWKELSNLKEPGQTYDELLKVLMEEHKKRKLKKHLDEIEENSKFTPLKDV